MGVKLPNILTEEELLKILDSLKKDEKYYKLAFMLGFYECMRISEIVALKPAHVDLRLKLLHIKEAKGHKDRNIPIAPEVMKGLKYLPITIGIRALQIAFKKKLKDILERDDLHFHSLRHSGITFYLTKKKWSSLEVQRMAGHSKIATTEIYAHINPQDLVDRMWEEAK